MPITVQHQPNFDEVANMAYQTGRGGAYLRERQRNDQLEQEAYRREMERIKLEQDLQQQQFQNQQQLYSNDFAQNNEQYNRYQDERNFGEETYQSDRNYGLNEAQFRQQGNQLDWQQKQNMQREEAQRRQEELKYKGTWTFSQAQTNRKNELLNEIEAFKQDDSIEPWQKEDELNKRYNEIDAMQPEKFEQQQGPTPDEQLAQRIATDAATGMRFIMKANGDFEPIKPEVDKQAEAQVKLDLDMQKAQAAEDKDLLKESLAEAKELLAKPDKNGKVTAATVDELSATAHTIFRYKKQLMSAAGIGQPQQQPDQPGIAETDQGAQQVQQQRVQQLQSADQALDAALASGDPQKIQEALAMAQQSFGQGAQQ